MLVAACSSGAAPDREATRVARDDCKLVLDDPAQAMVRVTERYPGDPVKVAQTIERCIAPTGDECERVDKIVHAIPSMMGSAGQLPASITSLEICRRMMTPEMRRCMLPSYALAHQDECTRLREQMAKTAITQLPITPRTRRITGAPACDVPDLAMERGRMTLVSGPPAHRVTTRHDGTPDFAWLEARLTAEKTAHPECGAVEITGGRGVRYADVITAMDVSLKVGLMDVGLDTGDDLSSPPGQEPPARPRSGTEALRNAPVVIITKDELIFGSSRIAGVAEVAAGADFIEPLARALPPAVDHMAILQADEATDMIVIVRAVRTLKRAGYNNVLFAVKNT